MTNSGLLSWTHTKTVLASVLRRREGNVAVIFALAAVPLSCLTGAAVDLAFANVVKVQARDAADAAVLAATSLDSVQNYALGPADSAAMETRARAFFTSNTQTLRNTVVSKVQVTTSYADNKSELTLKYQATYTPFFAGLIGIPTLPIEGEAQASATAPVYVDFYFLLDTSESMGLAVDLTNIRKLEAVAGCAFACHVPSSTLPGINTYDQARTNNVRLRIDALRDAVGKIVDRADTSQQVPNQYRIGVYTFDRDFRTLTPLSTDLAQTRSALPALDITRNVTSSSPAQTYFSAAFPPMNAIITPPGDGWTSARAKKFVFFVSDGLSDVNPFPYPAWLTSPLDSNLCDALKSRGISVGVIYTTYTPMHWNPNYNSQVRPWEAQIPKKMQACASPGLFYQADDEAALQQALDGLFSKATIGARLVR